jgi:hypothetical protein
MPAPPKDKSANGPVRRDAVSLTVAVTLVALAAGGICAVFWAPLVALVAR